MAAAETARLIASLELKDKLSPGIDKAVGKIGRLEGSLGRIGGIAQRGVSSAITNITRLGILAGAAIAGGVALGIRSLADLDRAVQQTNAVIASTKGKAGVSADAVRKYAEQLENLSTVDDKVIQDGENMLLTFTGIGKNIFPQATKAALNMAVAMAQGNVDQVDLKSSAIQLGKALNDPIKGITALRKVGVAFTEQQIKQIKTLVKAGKIEQAQKIILAELATEFGNAAVAAGKGPGAAWRRLQDTGEDLSQSLARGLLPVLTKAATWLSTKLADPAVVKTIDEIGQSLGMAGDELFKFVEKVDFKAIGDGLSIAVGAAKGIVSAFMGMPEWVKVAVIGGWGLNKLTGGALGDIVGELGKGLIKGVLGMNAGVVNINAGMVNGVGGVGGAAGAAAGGLGLASKVFLIGEAIGLGLLIEGVRQNLSEQNSATAVSIQQQQVNWLKQQPSKADLESGLAAVEKGINDIQANPLNVLVQGEALEKLKQMRLDIKAQLANPFINRPPSTGGASLEDRDAKRTGLTDATLQRALAAGFKPTAAAVEATFKRTTERQAAAAATAAAKIAAAISALKDRDQSPPVTNVAVTVNVTAAQVSKSIVIQRRFGPSGGSRERGATEFG